MSSTSVYRANAEECLRMARTAASDCDRPFWLNLAQSWLQLAEHSARASEAAPLEHALTAAASASGRRR